MAITSTWTDPSEEGAMDLDAGDTFTDTVYDYHCSNFRHIAGKAGFTATPGTAHGIEPASGYFMGGTAANWHIEPHVIAVAHGATGTITFANAFSATPTVTLGNHGTAWFEPSIVSKSTTTVVVKNNNGSVDGTINVLAMGPD